MNIHFYKRLLITGLISLMMSFGIQADPVSPPIPEGCKKPLRLAWTNTPPNTFKKGGPIKSFHARDFLMGRDIELLDTIVEATAKATKIAYCLIPDSHQSRENVGRKLKALLVGGEEGADITGSITYDAERVREFRILHTEPYHEEIVLEFFMDENLAQKAQGKSLEEQLKEGIITKLGIVVTQKYGANFDKRLKALYAKQIIEAKNTYDLIQLLRKGKVEAIIGVGDVLSNQLRIYTEAEERSKIRLHKEPVNLPEERGQRIAVSSEYPNAEELVKHLNIGIERTKEARESIIKKYASTQPIKSNPMSPHRPKSETPAKKS